MSFLSINTGEKKRINSLLKLNRRQKTLVIIIISSMFLALIIALSFLLKDERIATNLDSKNLSPSLFHPFGTDWLGRDMFTRTIKGLSLSIYIGIIASFVSVVVALVLGVASATMGKAVDTIITWFIDLFMAIPHLVAILLIAFTLGGGAKGVIVGVACTHWTSLARVIRAEVLQLKESDFIKVSKHMGKSPLWIALHHMLPHLIPQIF